MKKIALTIILSFWFALFIGGAIFTGCNSSANTVTSQPIDSTKFVSTPTVTLLSNMDTVYDYYYSNGADFRIAKIPFNGKMITIMFTANSSSDFKIVSIDTTFKRPEFKPQ